MLLVLLAAVTYALDVSIFTEDYYFPGAVCFVVVFALCRRFRVAFTRNDLQRCAMSCVKFFSRFVFRSLAPIACAVVSDGETIKNFDPRFHTHVEDEVRCVACQKSDAVELSDSFVCASSARSINR
jgi:hypothetical protein